MILPDILFSKVSNRGTPPEQFIIELVRWARSAPDEIFAPNDDPGDVYDRLKPLIGPWTSLLHRKAAMCELLRVLGGFESSWKWHCGVDNTNAHSVANIEGQETGIFQVSYDSLGLDDPKNTGDDLRQCVLKYCGALEVLTFIDIMKEDHTFALEYAARLLRNSYYWDGPIKRHEVDKWMSRDAVAAFMTALA